MPTAHVLLRDRRTWLGTRTGLTQDRDGALTLARVPGPADGKPVDKAVSYPTTRAVSGLALGPCEALFVADTDHDRVLYVDGQCNAHSWIGGFAQPRGLAIAGEALQVADSGHGRLQQLAFPLLEAHWNLPTGPSPASIAVDSLGRTVVADPVSATVRRYKPAAQLGAPDAAFNATLSAQGRVVAPLFVAIGSDDTVWVSDGISNQVDVFDANGLFLYSLPGPSGWLPGALAVSGARSYVADASNGHIHAFEEQVWIGHVFGWRGPVTALALHSKGDLLIKPGLDASYVRFTADAAHLPHATLTAGPFDAGEEQAWERAWVEAIAPTGTQLVLETAQSDTAQPGPTAADWHALPSDDSLLSLPGTASHRFVWLRLQISSTDSKASPRILQMRAASAAENYLDHLPTTYRRHDGTNGLLSRWLQLLRGPFSGVEELLDDMPRLADPQFADASSLAWLAQWLALELPTIANDDERRALLARAVSLMSRRGTVESMAEFVELHTGIRPAVVEAFASRNVWVLGESSRLGFDTQLAPLDPHGMVLPDPEVVSECSPGPIGSAVVGESGPLHSDQGSDQIGLPLFIEDAYRFCVVVDAYRVRQPGALHELRRIVDREKPAHTDYRVDVVAPELRVGFQARIGIDAIVGGPPPAWMLDQRRLGLDAHLMPADAAPRIDDVVLDGSLTLR